MVTQWISKFQIHDKCVVNEWLDGDVEVEVICYVLDALVLHELEEMLAGNYG